MFFQSKHGCFAFSQFRFSGELVVAKLERGVFGFLPMCATKGEIYFTRCGLIHKVSIISATHEAYFHDVFVRSSFINPNLHFSV